MCLKPATKTNRLYASHPHVAISGAITPHELKSLMSSRDMSNGFANRFLMVWAERSQVLPFPQSTPEAKVMALARRVQGLLEFAQAQNFAVQNHLVMQLSIQAQKLYAELYHSELGASLGGERVTALLERRAPMLLRIAMVLALTDLEVEISEQHLVSALAWIRLCTQTVQFVFSNARDDRAAARVEAMAERLMVFLRTRGKATRKEITLQCYGGHATKADMDVVIEHLLAASPPLITLTIQKHEEAGRKPTHWYSLAVFEPKIDF
jgi:hypothetical protein